MQISTDFYNISHRFVSKPKNSLYFLLQAYTDEKRRSDLQDDYNRPSRSGKKLPPKSIYQRRIQIGIYCYTWSIILFQGNKHRLRHFYKDADLGHCRSIIFPFNHKNLLQKLSSCLFGIQYCKVLFYQFAS